jgi:hypothetical protein
MLNTMVGSAQCNSRRLRVGLPCFVLLALLFAVPSGRCAAAEDTNRTWLASWRATNSVWRGVHLAVHDDRQATALIDALPELAGRGVNVIVAEVDYNFDFKSRPEVREEGYLTRARAGDLARAAHGLGIRVIPQINCLGHQSWSKNTGKLLISHPEFDETPGQFPENKNIYCRSWCPQNTNVNAVVFDLIDELVDAFDADAFHVGMDEVFLLASEHCPRCRGGDPAKLFAKAVNDLHGHIAGRRKLEMLMWGDRLLDARAVHASKWDASENGTQGAIDLIPKDIIICDWHYEKQVSYPSVAVFLEKGFRVWPAGFKPLEGARAFSGFARRQKNPRVIGWLATTWGMVKIPEMSHWQPLVDGLAIWKE